MEEDFVGRIFTFASKGKEAVGDTIGDFGGKASSAADTVMNMFGSAKVPT
jgi:hypothetical protein